ncbi:MAG: flagellar hook-basal body complex protein FliE [Alphaproteobacteria bacterium]|nr:flagellar hook-basal body complex protein FliE [Alphaproteobacteria bacterium]
MDAKVVNASIAYVEALKRTMDAGEGAPEVETRQSTPDFADILKDTISDTAGAVKGAEAVSIAAATKQATITDVVTAVTNAEMALESVVAVRDRVVQAYQDILRMPI